jgi:hypothetical protein
MRIIFTVTNDLNYDSRMIRICNSLSDAGYNVTLVGTRFKKSAPLQQQNYRQKRIRVNVEKGFGFYFFSSYFKSQTFFVALILIQCCLFILFRC